MGALADLSRRLSRAIEAGRGIRLDAADLDLIGADCFNKLIVANTKKYSGNGKPGASLVRDMAKLRDRVSDANLSRYGRQPHHFVFEVAA
jgi:hypothetical protein